jgi:hypothetical protein
VEVSSTGFSFVLELRPHHARFVSRLIPFDDLPSLLADPSPYVLVAQGAADALHQAVLAAGITIAGELASLKTAASASHAAC